LGYSSLGILNDLFAYSGYKFVGIIITLLADMLRIRGWLYWATFLYVFSANAFFLVSIIPGTTSLSVRTRLMVWEHSYGRSATLSFPILRSPSRPIRSRMPSGADASSFSLASPSVRSCPCGSSCASERQ
jgi:hypothetical protein